MPSKCMAMIAMMGTPSNQSVMSRSMVVLSMLDTATHDQERHPGGNVLIAVIAAPLRRVPGGG